MQEIEIFLFLHYKTKKAISSGVWHLNNYLYEKDLKTYKRISKILLEDTKFSHLMHTTYCKNEILLKND